MKISIATLVALAASAVPSSAFTPLLKAATRPWKAKVASPSLPLASSLDDLEGEDDAYSMWRIEKVDRIVDNQMGMMPNPLSFKANIPNSWFVENDAAVAAKVNVDVHQTCVIDEEAAAPAFLLAGPRKEIAMDPQLSRAAIVTCGGLCPGLNTVVREVVMCLKRQYGVEHVYGVPAGYRGFQDPSTWRKLDEEVVKNYHNMGGSVLGSSRGGHDTNAIVDALAANNINQLYVIGGDGTLRGAAKISDEIKARGLPIAVASIPKTIDNDIPCTCEHIERRAGDLCYLTFHDSL